MSLKVYAFLLEILANEEPVVVIVKTRTEDNNCCVFPNTRLQQFEDGRCLSAPCRSHTERVVIQLWIDLMILNETVIHFDWDASDLLIVNHLETNWLLGVSFSF